MIEILMLASLGRFFSRGSLLATLGLKGNPSHQEIKEAYYKTAKSLHPDTSTCPHASEQFIKAKDAYEALLNDSPESK
jgi:DnaJ-class molecular chaperone